MKIAFLNYFQGHVNRGAETFVNELSQRLSQNHEVEVIGGNGRTKTRWPILSRIYLDPQGIAVLVFTVNSLTKLWKGNFDIVIATNSGWQAVLVRIITWLQGNKLVISGQSGIGWDDRVNLLVFPNLFVPISTKALKWARKSNPFVKAVYIPNGVDLKKFSPHGETYKTKLAKPIILCVAALTGSKRINLVIRAISRLPGVSLLLVGDGPLKEKFRALGDRLLPGRFETLGVSHYKMPSIYRAADIFTLVPEKSEAFGIVYVEAMASGLPVVCPDDEQRREIVAEAGLYVKNPEDADKYAEVLSKALSKKRSDLPRRQAEKFSWDLISQRYQDLLLKLMK